ncbi:MarR family winged helix-turn-helix transcriptional regulator [Rariglobus hedericola]|uniref:MarR family transcriptional regulator n=1 Tax=Rariglobus hedericola TaxID=2597822 RepID=A0A556QQ77_9BACT|nr:MarR family transcriptional regulator [Rariglobus hedericola]TSJ78797.1 MarR family transcriptional regulator [Rariglobus hedericola]
MQRLVLKELPRYECLVEASKQFPDLEPAACEAFMHMVRASEDVMRVMNTHFASHNITHGRFLVMMLLMDKGGDCPRASTPAELADFASVSRATITGLLDTLERDGFVRREPDPADRRQMSVHLTLKGQAFMHGIIPEHFRLITQIMGSLSHNEQQTLSRLLTKVSMQVATLSASGADIFTKVEQPAAAQA